MDVRFVANMPYSMSRSFENNDIAGMPISARKPELPFVSTNDSSVSDEVREQVMMNLEEVQNFLYMLIGSKLRIHSDHDSIGSSVNTAV
ncbi:MAG: hypothetical protein A2176_01805 [Spirochaetes bacterium RBG_13_51_14]|nr:MAG: hypothetical protein A2176_01805 [Spirochaetes bacterium RBG_13_51_14]